MIWQSLVDSDEIEVKWKGEFNMYKVAKGIYSDTIYQYQDDCLGNQSLGVFIPSIRVGIEYQGIQHFKAVTAFGGEKGLKDRRRLDERKRTLCKENGVRLLEWKQGNKLTREKLIKAIEALLATDLTD